MQWHTPIGYKVINGKIEVYEEHKNLVVQIFTDVITEFLLGR